MSRENMEVLRQMRRAFNARDFDRALGGCDPQITWRYPTSVSGPLTLSGRADIKAFWEKLVHGWERFEVHEREVLGARADWVLVAVRFSGRGRESGAEVETELFEVARFSDGKLLSLELLTDREQALEAVGL